jgi:hypothetical protein
MSGSIRVHGSPVSSTVAKVNHIVMIAFDLLISTEIHTAIGLSSPLFSLFSGPSYATPPPRLLHVFLSLSLLSELTNVRPPHIRPFP